MRTMQTQETEGIRLNSFDPVERRIALDELASSPAAQAATGENVNMHLHSFFSYNARGLSPSALAWESRKAGLYAAGLCDFDVLDGLEEFLEAGPRLGLRVSANLETRAYLKEYAEAEINSPGEPGVTYIMGAGFVRVPPAGSAQAGMLGELRHQAAARNIALVGRINPHVGPASVDYEKDVVPLSPGRCPTERHIVRAYVNRAKSAFSGAALAGFWAPLLGRTAEETAKLVGNIPAFEEGVRARLVKKGGLGYEPPTPRTFPLVDDFVGWVLQCGAIPMATWLDGTSPGEADHAALLQCLRAKGVAAVNIIPDRNWNYSDPAARALKTRLLKEYVQAAEALNMPVNIGTEMNRDGLPFVDNLGGEALKPFRDMFRRGAQVMVGHTLLARYGGYSYTGRAAAEEFGNDVPAKNVFFASVGALPPVTTPAEERLKRMGPDAANLTIRHSAAAGAWCWA